MIEIRLHGRGGQGLIKASQIIVQSSVEAGGYASFIPFFGVERKGSPVYGFLRLDNKKIRPKTQVYNPDCLVVFDETLLTEVNVFEGVKDSALLVLNSSKSLENLEIPDVFSKIALLDATSIALKYLNRNIPNTAMLGAFSRVTGWLVVEDVLRNVIAHFGEANGKAFKEGYEKTCILLLR